jgi:hypothetical protein
MSEPIPITREQLVIGLLKVMYPEKVRQAEEIADGLENLGHKYRPSASGPAQEETQ